MDYLSEQKKLQEGSNYWKPKPGHFKIVALSELEETTPFVKGEGEEKEVHEQCMLRISIGQEEKFWTFGKGRTPASTYGQLVDIAVNHNNTLVGLELTVIVKSDGTKNDYTIIV